MSTVRLNIINSDGTTLEINSLTNNPTSIGSTTPITVSSTGVLTINNTTASSSNATGALILKGGLGVDGTINANSASFTSISAPHSGLTGLTAGDDHTQYAFLAGRTTGQTLIGGSAGSANLILRSTSNLTKGSVIIDETTEASSAITGAFKVSGGVGIAKKLYVTGNVSFSSDLNMNNTHIINIADPVNDGDAVNKSYVDTVAQGLQIKDSVRLGTTGPLNLATDFENGDTLDGETLVTGDRILIKDQTNGVENGIYVVQASGSPVRASDFLDGTNQGGAFAFVELGTQNGSTGWVVTNLPLSDVVGTDILVFSQFSGAGQITAGTGLTKLGNELSVNASLTHVTDVGTLNSLAVSGLTTLGATNSMTITSTGDIDIPGLVTLSTLTASKPLALNTTNDIITSPTTGTGSTVVLDTSPTLITPTLGVASATSLTTSGALTINGITTLGASTAATVSAAGVLNITNTTASTSTITGAVRIAGGLGVGGTIYASSGNFTSLSAPHSGLSGLTNDDHTQYALLAGRVGGQILTGGTASGNVLTLRSTTNATKGSVLLDETTASTSSTIGAFLLAGGISISNTTDATSSINGGTITSAGGLAIAKKAFIGADLTVLGITSLGATNILTVSAAGSVSIPGTVTLGSLTASKPLAVNGSNVLITSPTTGTGSTVVLDTSPTLVTPTLGVASATSLTTSGNLTVNGITTLGATNSLTVSAAGVVTVGGAATFSAGLTSTAGTTSLGVTNISGLTNVTNNTDATNSTTAALKTAGGIASALAIWAGGNVNTNGFFFCQNLVGAAPTFTTTRSTGTKIVLYNNFVNGTSADYALGTESGAMWYGVPTTTQTHKFYNGLTNSVTFGNTTATFASAISGTTITTSGKVSIGGTDPLGLGRLFLTGANSSATTGPTISVYTALDNFPIFQQLNFTHDNVSLNFDMYYDTTWKTSHTTNGFQIYKTTNELQFIYTSTTGAGIAATRVNGLVMNSSGLITIGASTPVTITAAGVVTVGGAATFSVGLTSTAGTTTLGATTIGAITGTSATYSGNVTINGITTLGATNSTTVSATGVMTVNGAATFSAGITSTAGTTSLGTTNISGLTNVTNNTDATNSTTAALKTAGGIAAALGMYIGGIINTDSYVFCRSTTANPPTFTTNRSTGTKLLVSPLFANGTSADYAIGLETNAMWYGVPTTTQTHKFYNGLTNSVTFSNTTATFASAISGTSASLSSTLSVTGVVTLNNLTASQAVFTDASKNLVSIATTGSGNVVLATSPTLVTPTLGVASATSLTTSGALTVNGITTLGATNSTTVSAAGVMTVNGAATFAAGLTSTAATTTLGATTIGTITGTSATFSGTVSIGGKNITPNTDDITSQVTFTGVQSATNANVTGLSFNPSNTRTFKCLMSVVIVATSSLYAQFELNGIYNGTSWYFVSNYLGDNTNVTFAITNAGQVTYSSTTYPGFSSLTMKFKATTIAI